MPGQLGPRPTPLALVSEDLQAMRETLENMSAATFAAQLAAGPGAGALSDLWTELDSSIDSMFARLEELELTLIPILRPEAARPSRDVAGDLHLAGPIDVSPHGPARRASITRRNRP